MMETETNVVDTARDYNTAAGPVLEILVNALTQSLNKITKNIGKRKYIIW